MDDGIHWINFYPADDAIFSFITYLLDSAIQHVNYWGQMRIRETCCIIELIEILSSEKCVVIFSCKTYLLDSAIQHVNYWCQISIRETYRIINWLEILSSG